jgi:phosphatidylserine/phosphatidylglycerophosphate/cardiolipin synthase-like enzyme
MTRVFLIGMLLGLALPTSAPALQVATGPGTWQAAFTPGDDVGALVVEVIGKARRQVLVQAFSFTHRAIADALIAAHRRGVDVRVIADQEQTHSVRTSVVDRLVSGGVPVWLDGEHAAAHNKVMIVDAGTPMATVITGSFNFTHAGQYRNAENVLIVRDHPGLAETYAANWRAHREHSHPIRK